MNNAIQRKIILGTSYVPLIASRLVGSVTISAPPTNAAAIYFRSDDDADDVPWQPGEFHSFKSVDLSSFRVKGASGDILTINGGTW